MKQRVNKGGQWKYRGTETDMTAWLVVVLRSNDVGRYDALSSVHGNQQFYISASFQQYPKERSRIDPVRIRKVLRLAFIH
jgi:hypothetical protein